MPVIYKIDVLAALKASGYSTYRLRKEKLLAEATIQSLRSGRLVSWDNLGRVCSLTGLQPGDLLAYERDIPEGAVCPSSGPNNLAG